MNPSPEAGLTEKDSFEFHYAIYEIGSRLSSHSYTAAPLDSGTIPETSPLHNLYKQIIKGEYMHFYGQKILWKATPYSTEKGLGQPVAM